MYEICNQNYYIKKKNKKLAQDKDKRGIEKFSYYSISIIKNLHKINAFSHNRNQHKPQASLKLYRNHLHQDVHRPTPNRHGYGP